jgi:hypothetical protein
MMVGRLGLCLGTRKLGEAFHAEHTERLNTQTFEHFHIPAYFAFGKYSYWNKDKLPFHKNNQTGIEEIGLYKGLLLVYQFVAR